MYLSTLQTRHLTILLDVLTKPGDSATLRQRLVRPVADLMNADYVASLVWNDATQQFGEGVCCHSDATHLREYEATYQFEDPIAKLLHPRRYPTLVTQVIPQRELVKSEFFDRFLHSGSMYWGVNLYAHDGHSDVGDLRIWRAKAKQNFDTNEVDILRCIYPSLVNALADAKVASPKRQAHHKTKKTVDGASTYSRSQELGLKHKLSQRELQVAELVALGHTDKEIARQAGVAYTTVRTYLEQALAKTGCGNRKKLIAYLCSF